MTMGAWRSKSSSAPTAVNSSMSSVRLLIIGYGNRLRGDDAAGYLAAESLRTLLIAPDIEILAVHQLTPELAEPIAVAGRVIFLDAAASGTPGEIVERSVTAH